MARKRAREHAAVDEQILNVAKAEVEAEVEPDSVGDHVWQKAVTTVDRRRDSGAGRHRASLPGAHLDNPPAHLHGRGWFSILIAIRSPAWSPTP